ncbi:unnamed protein product [Leptidea sinapis]|uniref:Nose resistant-to-fluoxetine protein N-terminal domain-containing protein n=1 Tax=Leptidea sinapis TaxID=189913 RepID=A0A5E4QX82_9NEOP|nr:unnamed protein product [Leptidea sinapis]
MLWSQTANNKNEWKKKGVSTGNYNSKDENGYTVIDMLADNIVKESWSQDEKPCLDEIMYTLRSAKNSTLWATWIMDSMQPPVGVFYGSRHSLGNFDQCVDPPWLHTNHELRTKYCLADVILSDRETTGILKDPYETAEAYINSHSRHNMRFREFMWGVCVPAKCRNNSTGKLFKAFYRISHLANVVSDPRINVVSCQVAGVEVPKQTGFYIFISIIISAIVTVLVGIARALSIKTNAISLITQTEEDILVIHGVRAFVSGVVVLLHLYFVQTWIGVGNARDLERKIDKYGYVYIYQMESLVDTYLLLSGLFLIRSFMKLDKTNLLMLVLKRYLRFMFFVGPTVLYMIYVYQQTGSGPIWIRLTDREMEACYKTWWANVLMLGNYIDTPNIVSIANIFGRSRQTAIALYSVLLVISIILPALYVYQNRILPVAPFGLESVHNYRQALFGNELYLSTHLRATPYLVGLALGYVMSIYKPSHHRNIISNKASRIIFTILVLMTAYILRIGGLFHYPDMEYSLWNSVAFALLHRITWALIFSCFLVICEYGCIPYVQNYLTWPPWIPCSKLSYGFFLVHTVFYGRIAGTIRSPVRFDMVEMKNPPGR